MSHFSVGFGLAVALVVGQGTRENLAAEEFKPLVRGDDPAQFALVGVGSKSVSIRDGEVRVSGTPDGYFATRESYKNYVLRFEWMYERPEGLRSEASFQGNSGLLIHIAEPHKVWPVCIESQLMNADAGSLFGVSTAKFHGSKDAKAQKKAVKPVGEWNLQRSDLQGRVDRLHDQRRRGLSRRRRIARPRGRRLAVRGRPDPVPEADDQAARMMAKG